MEPNTNEWLMWRHRGIGSSDAAIIMDKSPYKTPYQLWEEKIQPSPPKEEKSFILDKGHRLEKKARAAYELETGIEAKPQLAENAQFSFLRSSLDGWVSGSRRAVEMKYVGKEYFEKTNLQSDIKEMDHIQLHHQFMVSGCVAIDYVLYNDEYDKIKIVMTSPDVEFCKTLLEKELNFWNMVKNQIAPPLSNKDWKSLKSKPMETKFQKYFEFDKSIKLLTASQKKVKEEIIKKMNHPRVKCGKYSFVQSLRIGNIDYKNIPDIQRLDPDYLNSFRKPPSKTVKLSLAKDLKTQ